MPKILYFVILFAFTSINASVTTINCNAPSYKGFPISFYHLSDPFTQQEVTLSTQTVDSTGLLSVKFDLNEITIIYTHLGIFKGYMYAEPGKTYSIALPDFVKKSETDKFNPFFKEVEFRIGVLNQTDSDINFLIRTFDDSYYPYYNKFIGNVYNKNTPAILDSAIRKLLQPYKNVKHPYFENFIKYRIGNLKHQAYMQRAKSVSKQYFQQQPILYDNIAYWDLFNQTYNRYLMFFGRGKNGKKVFDDINNDKSFSKLWNTLNNDSILTNHQLRELVILKGVYDEFYSDKFSRTGLLSVLDSLSTLTKYDLHKLYAQNIRKHITRLMSGYAPPAFELQDTSGRNFTLNDFKGKYIYLNFCACSSYSCMKEFDDIAKVYEKHKEHLQIITIVCDDKLDDIRNFLQKKKYPWLFLNGSSAQTNVLKNYDIRAFPTYFLIGPDGTLLMSPAISPKENFEWQLFELMRKKGDI